MNGPPVCFDDVSKRYRPASTTRRSWRRAPRPVGWALREVSFEAEAGQMVGLVGVNGSGKSTLLRIAAALTAPTSGSVRIDGRVAGILSLGSGFHPLLTGRENALTAAIIAGMSRREAERRLDSVLDFSELGAAVDDPTRTYSSGMWVRLAYSVAAHVDADVLLVDEALAVGDLAFSAKCIDHLKRLRSEGATILLASHDLATLRQLCDRVLWLHRGREQRFGEPDDVLDRYERATHEATLAHTTPERSARGRLGAGELEILEVRCTTTDGAAADRLPSGWPLTIELDISPRVRLDTALVGVSIHAPDGTTCLDMYHPVAGPMLDPATGPSTLRLELERLDLANGVYQVAVGTYEPDFARAHDYWWQAVRVEVVGRPAKGWLAPPHRWARG